MSANNFDDFFKAHYARAIAYVHALGMRDHEQCQEIANNAFIKFSGKIFADFDRHFPLLLSMLRKTWIDAVRRINRKKRQVTVDADMAGYDEKSFRSFIEQISDGADLRTKLERDAQDRLFYIRRVVAQKRNEDLAFFDALIKGYMDGTSEDDLAAELGITKNILKVRRWKLYRFLRDNFNNDGTPR